LPELNYIYIVEGFRQYGDSWIEDIFDSEEKASNYIKSKTDNLGEDDDLILTIKIYMVK